MCVRATLGCSHAAADPFPEIRVGISRVRSNSHLATDFQSAIVGIGATCGRDLNGKSGQSKRDTQRRQKSFPSPHGSPQYNPLFMVCPRNYESVREECHLKNCRWVGVAIPWAGERIHTHFLKLDGRSGSKTEVPRFARLSSSGSCGYELAIGTRLRRAESPPTLNMCMS